MKPGVILGRIYGETTIGMGCGNRSLGAQGLSDGDIGDARSVRLVSRVGGVGFYQRGRLGLLLIARLRGTPVGCGALKFHRDAPAELKRMWVAPDTRGLGLGRRILTALEHQAAGHGAEVVRLETNASLVEAIALYRSSGYREVAAFNDEPFADHWFAKDLGRP
jgi:ribosomal protein S18 acetylase RimI-like enzyme